MSKLLLVARVVWWRRASSPQTLLRVIVCAMRSSEALITAFLRKTGQWRKGFINLNLKVMSTIVDMEAQRA